MTNALWFPYAQMKTMSPPYRVASAKGARLMLEDGRELIDALSSWWCVIHGYNHPEITAAAKAQLDTLPHVMLGGLVHRPAEELAERLVAVTPDGLNRVFFGDSGSVGVEIALKMGIQFHRNQGRERKKILCLIKAYHGDTTGCMSVCDPYEGMHSLFAGSILEQPILDAPTVPFHGDADALAHDVGLLESFLEAHHEEIAGFILEPLMQAAGGFNFYSPEYLKAARELCDRFGVLLIFDEVATGFGRTGSLFAADQAGVTPDIMILGKGLTAGYQGLSATLATDRVYDAFYDDDPMKSFMHGPTFMGNPTACAIALKSLDLCLQDTFLPRIKQIESLLKEELLPLRRSGIVDTRVLGATGVIEVESPKVWKGIQDFAADRGVWLRPFENYVYTMPPYVITDEELRRVTAVMREWFGNPARESGEE
ncbi:MAG: adenosylmethionine--8-amino-7-oxononanoate transaminase [Planctomycetota bacterium]|jgi:adenosylmethionine-8-amino-7-oxononanoate aminotransferase